MPNRSDYLAVFEAGGAEALNDAIRERNPTIELYERELLRMERLGVWEVAWDPEQERSKVVRRMDIPVPRGRPAKRS
jgi:hypothetical protein